MTPPPSPQPLPEGSFICVAMLATLCEVPVFLLLKVLFYS